MRRIVRACLRHQRLESLIPEAELLVTELTANAFQHGTGRTVSVRVWRTDHQVRIEVGGGSAIDLRTAHPDEDDLAENGRGLSLVAGLASAFGLSGDRTRVWCTLDIPEGER
ncbi:ATP-binding protein [Streptomyces jumonjinensis]|uniref:ATP-binding protein n=1 Tax=Streptomyces jumonjinensis TaxID=1945 RepID=UPI0037BCB293